VKKIKIVVPLLIALVAAIVGIVWLSNPANLRQRLAAGFHGSVVQQEPRVRVAIEPGPQQPRVSPAEAGIDMTGIQAAVDYAGTRNTRALLIGRGGHIVFEKYWDGSTLDTLIDLSGFTPALTALLLGVVMNDERSVNLDAPLNGYLSEWTDDPRGLVSLRQLVTRSSGFARTDGASDAAARVASYASGDALRATLLAWPLDAALRPGESPIDVNADILGIALAGRLRQPFDKLLAERIWRPIEGGEFSLAHGARAGCCIRARIGDWMRVGEILANNGVFEGSQLVSPNYVAQMLRPTYKGSSAGFFTHVGGSFASHDVAWLEDAGRQRLWIAPSLHLVILRVGDEPPAAQGWDEAMIPDSIIRSTSGWAQSSAGQGIDPSNYAPH
jgi:CubicO group peptidase (beta-lactamase class C family)